MRTMKEDFKRLLDNNKDKDWNDLTFRETMADAFRFNINKRIEWLRKEVKDTWDTNDYYIGELLVMIDTAFQNKENEVGKNG